MLSSPLLLLGATAVAAAISALAWRGRRVSGPRCPRCGYDMRGADGLRCPECGYEAALPERLTRRRRRWRAGAGAGLVTIALGALFVRAAWRAGWQYALLPTLKVTERVVAGPFTIEVLEVRNPAAIEWQRRLQVRRGGDVLLAMTGHYFEIGARLMEDGVPVGEPVPLLDLTGDAKPDLVISLPSGGSGGDARTLIFAVTDDPVLGAGLTPIAVLDVPGAFENVDGEGVPEFLAGDGTYRYIWTSGAESPHPNVILRWGPGGYEPDPVAMRARRVTRCSPLSPAADVIACVIDLIYAGKGDEAVQLLEDAISHGGQPRADMLLRVRAKFPTEVTSSPYVDAIIAANEDQNRFLSWLYGSSK